MYRLHQYGNMINDKIRVEAYAQAMRQAIRPGCVVLDIGTGPGFFALLACQLGAGRVYALDPNEAVRVGPQLAAANGYAAQIVFIEDVSTNVTLPEPADVIISDLRGVLPLNKNHIESIIDARQRLLAPGGTLIPLRDKLWATLVEAPGSYAKRFAPWEQNDYNLDLGAARDLISHGLYRGRVKSAEQFLAPPQVWATLDYQSIAGPHAQAELGWEVSRAGTAHGLSLWFEAILAEEISYDTRPDGPPSVYGSGFLPLSQPITVAVGDEIQLSLRADLISGSYIWTWKTRVLTPGGQVKASFKQSTFLGRIPAPLHLSQQADHHQPALNEVGQIDHFILSLMTGEHALDDIAHQVAARFPERFPNHQDARDRVNRLSRMYHD